jgi:hypothetical protein
MYVCMYVIIFIVTRKAYITFFNILIVLYGN